MPDEGIIAGDVVRLKSGGPLMTVETLSDYAPTGPKNGVRCIWFDGKVKTVDVFSVDVLEKVDMSESGGATVLLR